MTSSSCLIFVEKLFHLVGRLLEFSCDLFRILFDFFGGLLNCLGSFISSIRDSITCIFRCLGGILCKFIGYGLIDSLCLGFIEFFTVDFLKIIFIIIFVKNVNFGLLESFLDLGGAVRENILDLAGCLTYHFQNRLALGADDFLDAGVSIR